MRAAYATYERTDADLVAQMQILKKEFDGYGNSGYLHFKSEILPLELVRLAKKRMTIPVEKEKDHLIIQGQYAEVERLMFKRENIEAEIEVLETQRIEILTQMNTLKNKIALQVKDAKQ